MKQRIAFIDYIRTVACFLVILVHASENFYIYNDSLSIVVNSANRFWVAFYDGGVARTCVPLFMIVSAFLLVPMKPGMTMTGFYRHRFLRILPPFVLFLVLYSVLPALWGERTWAEAVSVLAMTPLNFPANAGHLWFMYPLISLYLIIPVVSPWLEKSSAKDELIFISIFAFTTFLPWIHRFVSPSIFGEALWNGFGAFWYCSGYLGYLVLAHYIRFHIHWSRARRLRIGTVCFIVGSAFTAWSFWWKAVPGIMFPSMQLEWSWEFCTPNLLLSTFGAFLLFSCIEGKAPRFVTEVGKLSFGMYLMHMFFLNPISQLVIGGNVARPLLPVSVAIPVIALATYLCCIAMTKLLSYLPAAEYIVGYSSRRK